MASSARLALDLRDVAVWLDANEPGMLGELIAAVNYVYDDRMLSGVLVDCSAPEVRRKFRADAKRALTALGYQIEPTGGDVYSVSAARRRGLSADVKMKMLERVRAALAGESVGPPMVIDPPPVWPTSEELAKAPYDDDF